MKPPLSPLLIVGAILSAGTRLMGPQALMLESRRFLGGRWVTLCHNHLGSFGKVHMPRLSGSHLVILTGLQ